MLEVVERLRSALGQFGERMRAELDVYGGRVDDDTHAELIKYLALAGVEDAWERLQAPECPAEIEDFFSTVPSPGELQAARLGRPFNPSFWHGYVGVGRV